MKYMDEVQSADEAIEWFRLFQNYTTRKYNTDYGPYPEYYLVMPSGLDDGPYTANELIATVLLKQWQRYAYKMIDRLVEAGLYDDQLWEMCSAE